jgi:hypothetical protein
VILRLLAAGALLLAPGTARAPAETPARVPARAPEARAGPYRVVVDRIAHNPTLVVTYTAPGGQPGPPVEVRRSAQLQIALYTDDPAAAKGLASLQVHRLTSEQNGRISELSHYGGVLPDSSDGAVIRASVSLTVTPALVREIRALEGEIVSFTQTQEVEIEVPVAGRTLPVTVEKSGVRATVQELARDGSSARVGLTLEGPATSMLLDTSNDGSRGVELLNTAGSAASPSGGTLTQPRPARAEYRLGFLGLRGEPGLVRFRVLLRSGTRRVFPFRLEHIPLPFRPESRLSKP